MGELFEDEIKSIEDSVEELIGKKININSSKQLAEVLFEDLELPVIKKNKTGPSTDQEVLEALSGRHEIIDYILRYRTITKLKTTYIDGMVDLIKKTVKSTRLSNKLSHKLEELALLILTCKIFL